MVFELEEAEDKAQQYAEVLAKTFDMIQHYQHAYLEWSEDNVDQSTTRLTGINIIERPAPTFSDVGPFSASLLPTKGLDSLFEQS